MPELTLAPFAPEHLDSAAELLAARHARHRRLEPELPPRFEEASECRRVLEQTLSGPASGVVALRDGDVVGYVLARLRPGLTRSAQVRTEGCAVAAGEGFETYREMYASAAPAWFRQGFFVHDAVVMAGDDEAREAWYSLGFGQEKWFALRDTSPVGGEAEEVVVRRATAADQEDVERLWLGLGRYNAGSAIFRPFIIGTPEEMERWSEGVRQQVEREDYSYWLAYLDGRAVGLMIFTPATTDMDEVAAPPRASYLRIAFVEDGARAAGVGTALLERGLAWLRERGDDLCTVAFFAGNLVGARYWRGKGFRPLFLNLERRIDERLAWADGREG